MAPRKLSKEDCERILKLINEGFTIKELAKRFGVHRTTAYNRCKCLDKSRKIPVETKNKVIKAIKQGYTKAEAAEMYGLNIGTVFIFTRRLKGYRSQGNHIIRKNGIKLLNRLMSDGYMISDFNVPMVRNLQHKFPIIQTARYKEKTFFYLPGKEEETVEAFFREKPDRIINYSAIEELSYLLGIKISKHNQKNLLDKYKGKHASYWKSRRIIQRSIDDWLDEPQSKEVGFRLMPKR